MTSLGIEVQALGFSYGSKRALENVSFGVAPNQFCALLGPNGAGKSTLFALLTRLFTASEGTIKIAGHDIARSPRAALANMGVVFQQPTLDLDLSVRRNLSYFAALQGLGGKEARVRIDAALDQLGMKERADERARDLNGGHRRRAEIARALVHRPKVLLLDEPTVGLDVAARHAIVGHVHELAQTGLSVLWATHLTDEIAPSDQLILLHQGHILIDSTAEDFAQATALSERYIALTNPREIA
ncbi:MAG: ABC transporter ATP-binding protein [Paracoccaceae bacterium]